MSCKEIKHKNLMPGWGCCQCHTYNGEQRLECKECAHPCCADKDEESDKDLSKLN